MSKTQKHVKHVKTAKQATASAAAVKAFTQKAATVAAAAKPTAADEPTHYERAMARKTGASVAQLRKETAAAMKPTIGNEEKARIAKHNVREPKNLCLCGCGQRCWKNFKQGHDQRLRGMLQRKEAQPLPKTVAQAVKIGVLVGEYKHANQEVLA